MTSPTEIPKILFLGSPDDKEFLPHLKSCFSGYTVLYILQPLEMLTQLEMYCSSRSVSKIVSTSIPILEKLLRLNDREGSAPSLESYSGSFFTYKNLEIVFISPLSQLFTVKYGKFLATRYISKLISPDKWIRPTPFTWEILSPTNIDSHYEKFQTAFAISVDIETFKRNLAIRCIGYTGIFIDPTGHISTISLVLPLDSLYALSWMRKFNLLLAPKIFQNGKYDCSYLLRYNAAPVNWVWDTAHMFHSFYSELPKDLGFLNAFFLREVIYWKDMAYAGGLEKYYEYNARDTWATANVLISMILELPDWAARNYTLEFPLVFPCLLAEMTGIRRDMSRLTEARKQIDAQESAITSYLQRILRAPSFNPGSPKQVVDLLKLLGCGDITSSGETELDKASFRHPLVAHILGKVLEARGLRKLKTTYLRLDSDGEPGKDNGSKEFFGRIIYALNPHGTDTGRLASKEHHFWTGLQIQNIPVGEDGELSWTKTTICSEDGFNLGECDLEQAETRDTAYIAGENNLIEAINSPRDFHSHNASAFFGLSYESLYDDGSKKSLNKPIRNISKRTNHGANYNMGAGVLVTTMGLENIFKARTLLSLPYNDPKEIGEYLLRGFHHTYPGLRGENLQRGELYKPGTYYATISYEITISSRITSRAYHHTEYNLRTFDRDNYIETGDWTRYCFGKPDKNKLDLNSYVAHPSQSLNARTLNEAWMRVFYEIALPNPIDYRLHAQVHDSILFSYREGRKDLADKTRQCMEIPVTVRDVHGTYRTFTVPAALKIGKPDKPAKYWSETE